MSVNRPAQIEPALELLDEALERAPSQNVPMLLRSSGQYLTLKPYLTVDAEFWEVDGNGKLRESNSKTFSSQMEGAPHGEVKDLEGSGRTLVSTAMRMKVKPKASRNSSPGLEKN